jgi:hypothetical protein
LRGFLIALLGLVLLGCGTRGKNTIDDIEEEVRNLTGNPVEAEDRWARILECHDRTNPDVWILLGEAEGESYLRKVVRDIEKLEKAGYEDSLVFVATIGVLREVSEKSSSAVVRSRALIAMARLVKELPLDTEPEPKLLDAKSKARLDVLFRQVREAEGQAPAARKDALVELASFRFWPPRSFSPPRVRGSPDWFDRSWRDVRALHGFLLVQLRQTRLEEDDVAFEDRIGPRLLGLTAELVRFVTVAALLRDKDAEVRYDVVGCLEEIGTGDLVPPIAAAVDEEVEQLVRFRLAQGLDRLGAEDMETAFPALLVLLEDHEQPVRHAAHAALVHLTSEDHGEKAGAWKAWWATERRLRSEKP